ncbi:MAG: hypothetical protein Q8Q07_05935 [Dehalococcoidales bacterium]|nr:hypothetical protein [Dehalococcoidales bacterium]
MAMKTEADNEGAKATEIGEITFTCKLCEKSRPLDDMVVVMKYFPPVVVCRDCEKKIR